MGELNDEPDEFQAPEPHIEKTGENTWSVIGNVELSDVEEALGIEIETEEDIDTFTGLVFDELGMIPNEGAQNIDLEIRNMKIHVSSIAEHQIEAATIILKEEPICVGTHGWVPMERKPSAAKCTGGFFTTCASGESCVMLSQKLSVIFPIIQKKRED